VVLGLVFDHFLLFCQETKPQSPLSTVKQGILTSTGQTAIQKTHPGESQSLAGAAEELLRDGRQEHLPKVTQKAVHSSSEKSNAGTLLSVK
jgi:hypothetical protein